MPTSPRSNRGPGAASENRAALITAARAIFADHGLGAPLSAVAREAGVGQGSLYRHFPSRNSLAIAVFEQNVDELEAIAALATSELGDVLRVITDQAIVSTAFFEMIEPEHTDAADRELASRVASILSAKLPAAQQRGQVPASVTTDDVLLAVAMLAGALAKAPRADRDTVALRAWGLLPFGPTPPPS